jgi:hypothetical protein
MAFFVKIQLKSIEKSNIIVEQACWNAWVKARFLSGQKGRTVNPLTMSSLVRIQPSPPTYAKATVGAAIFLKDCLKN